jgi:hypothetical protein
MNWFVTLVHSKTNVTNDLHIRIKIVIFLSNFRVLALDLKLENIVM